MRGAVNMEIEERKVQPGNTYKKISIFYIVLMGFFQLSDKMYGAGFVAFMNAGGLTAFQIGFILSFQDLALAFFDYPSGNIADRRGRKKIGNIGLVIWGSSLIAFAYSSNFVHFLLSSLLMALGLALFSGSHFSWYIDELIRLNKYEYRAKILPWNRGIIMSFSIAGALLASYLVKLNIQVPLIVAGLFAITAGIISFFIFHDNYGDHLEVSFFKHLKFNTKQFFEDKAMKIIVGKNFISSIGYSIFILYWQIYGIEELKLDYSLLGVLLIVMTIMLTISNFIVSFLTKFLDIYRITVLGGVFIIAGFGVLATGALPSIGGGLVLFIVGIVVLEIGIGIDDASTNTWVQDHIDSQNRSSFNSALSSLSSLTGFLMLPAVGFIIDHVSSSRIWFVAGASSTLSLVLIIYFLSFLKKNLEGQAR